MENSEEDFNDRMQLAIRAAEILSVYFARVGKTLILDFRHADGIEPAVMVDDIVSTPQARLQSFRRLRPGFPLPERLTIAPWASAVRDFRAIGLLDEILRRCEAECGPELKVTAERAFQRLESIERRYLRDLVRGVGMETIWQRSDP